MKELVYLLSRFLFVLLFKIFFRIDARGQEFIPKKGGFILAGNHLSLLDPPGVGILCPRRLKYMARDDLFLNPIVSWWLYAVGVFPVKRDSADISAIKEAISCVKRGWGLLLFPEGTRRSANNIPGDLQPGIGFLASKLEVPVIPVYIKGSDKALPKGARFFRFKKVSVFFGEQLQIDRKMPYQEITREIMQGMRHLEEKFSG